MENKNCPFVVGQQVVCLKNSHSRWGGQFIKDEIYTVHDLRKCSKCGKWMIVSNDVILHIPLWRFECCIRIERSYHGPAFGNIEYFAPIKPLYSDITSSLAKEALEGVGDKVDGPVREIKETVKN